MGDNGWRKCPVHNVHYNLNNSFCNGCCQDQEIADSTSTTDRKKEIHMGDRAMCEIKTSEGSLFVYTHWCGSVLPEMAAAAVKAAKGRLDGDPYGVRIIVDQLTKPGRDETTGFGIMLKPNCEDEYNDNKPSVVIDAETGGITVLGKHKAAKKKA